MTDGAESTTIAVENGVVNAEAPTLVRYRVMAFLCALSFLTYFDRICIVRAQHDIQHDLSISDPQMGWVLGIFWLAYGFFEIPGGWLGDRFGPRIALVRIVLAWSLFTALSGSCVGFLTLFVCRLCFGVGEAGAYPNMAAIQSRWVPLTQRAQFSGVLWLFARWGGAFSPLIFGSLLRGVESEKFRGFLKATPVLNVLSEAASWRFGFWTAGFLGIIWCVSFYPWFRNDPADCSGVNNAERDLLAKANSFPAHSKNSKEVWRALFTSKSLWCLSVYYFFGGFAWSFFISWAPRFLKDTYNVDYQDSEWMTAMPLFFGGIACLIGGLLCDALVHRIRRKRLVRACFPIAGCLISSAAMFASWQVDSALQATILLCIAAAAFDMGQSANWASIIDIGGHHAGIAAGMINMIGNLGGFAQPVIGGYVFSHFGWSAMFALYGVAFVIAASMWIFINPEQTFISDKKHFEV